MKHLDFVEDLLDGGFRRIFYLIKEILKLRIGPSSLWEFLSYEQDIFEY